MRIEEILSEKEIKKIQGVVDYNYRLQSDNTDGIGFTFNEVYILNPFVDEKALITVDPIEYYGESFITFLLENFKNVIDVSKIISIDYLQCEWCFDTYTKDEMEETNLGLVCETCIRAIRNRGEKTDDTI